ncbi:hypothetical protein ACU635_14245 [[Actinomadura] parvosata]|uniref:hypothetical protein n=1 Tax=[Actinomadura] parvosata TaxID=1955412 RepID=UPI00406CEAC7
MDFLTPLVVTTVQALQERIAETVRETVPDPRLLSDWQVSHIAQAVAAQIEEAGRNERARQRRREWKLAIFSLIAGALISIPIGIWINNIS